MARDELGQARLQHGTLLTAFIPTATSAVAVLRYSARRGKVSLRFRQRIPNSANAVVVAAIATLRFATANEAPPNGNFNCDLDARVALQATRFASRAAYARMARFCTTNCFSARQKRGW